MHSIITTDIGVLECCCILLKGSPCGKGVNRWGTGGTSPPHLLKVGGTSYHLSPPPPTFLDQTHYWKHEKLLCFNNIIHLTWFLLHSALKCLYSMANIQKVPTYIQKVPTPPPPPLFRSCWRPCPAKQDGNEIIHDINTDNYAFGKGVYLLYLF